MRTAVEDVNEALGEEFAIRIGIHTGPAVAGVIGRRKFIYDLWGDTVNTASRMESHGAVGEIQISTATRERLGERFEIESLGPSGPGSSWLASESGTKRSCVHAFSSRC